ncbi:MAG: hypothetical protein ABI668_12600 [Sphingorhabdus sp.]
MPNVIGQWGERRTLARWDNEGGAPEREGGPLPEPVMELAKRLGIAEASRAKLVTLTQTVQELTMVPQARDSGLQASIVDA